MLTNSTDKTFDAIIIGGSYAGVSAAMQLARARQRVLVIDAGIRRNRFAATSHGFLGQDGRSPIEIALVARAQLLAYPNVHWLDGTVTRASKSDDHFDVATWEQGPPYQAKRLVLATGIVDEVPEIEGLAERWGRTVFHCPYCHGYELNQGRIGVLAVSPLSFHHAMMLPDWGEVFFFTNEAIALDDTQREKLLAKGVVIEPQRVVRISDKATVELVNGRRIEFSGLFTFSRTRMATAIPEQLGCAFEDGPMGPFIRTDGMKETSVPGVFACGDAARMGGNVAMAVGDGAIAGGAAHQSIVFR